jgi:sulfite dehydrogenase
VRGLVIALSVLVLALAFGACGDDSGSSGGGGSSGGSAGGTDGKQLFAGTCGGCHTLADAGTSGTLGPNLDELKPDQARVEKAIASGPGAMPENLFEGAQAEAVATYVSGAAGK